jgi:hypothetical protein
VGIADLNRDSKADLIWESDSGQLVVWYMNGITMSSWAYLNPNNSGDPNWRVVGAGDLNADGKPDLIWRHALTRGLAAWFMNGATRSSWSWLSPNTAATGWNIRAVLDLNGDGRTDLVWQHTSGAVAAWLMNGATAVSMPSLSPDTVDAGWELVAPR